MIIFCRSAFFTFLKVVVGLIIVAHLLPTTLSFGRESEPKYPVLRIAAASNLRFSMEEIAAAFEQEQGIRLKISYGASGNLLAQILAGAPFDLFFSADEAMPLRLIDEGLGKSEDYFIYGTGQIVLWVPGASPIDLEDLGADALLHSSVNKIAIANPRHAPYGIAAIATLKHLHLFGRLKEKLILGENISQAATFVKQGHAEIGVLSYALALSKPLIKSGRFWHIPSVYHPALKQGGLVLYRSKRQFSAKEFVRFIKSGKGLSILEKYGFLTEEARP